MRMVQNGGGGGGFPAGWNMAVKPCDTCKIAAALLFCRKDSVFLCIACDVKLHGHVRHERVWMCEVCEQAPASVTCRADAASLCVTCDVDIHSANPLARRHDRIPVVPFYDCAETFVKSAADILLDDSSGDGSNEFNNCITNECNINWGIPTETSNIDVKFPSDDSSPVDIKSIDLFFPAADELLDFDFPILTDARLQSQIDNPVNDSIVPVQTTATEKDLAPAQFVDQYEIDFTTSNIHSYNSNSYPAPSLSHSVSSSSIEVGVVPEANLMLDISNSFMLPLTGVIESNSATDVTQQATPLSGMDRVARVLRYREKRKNRRFEKTIRYASRKAYAETRPRIKGRFAKRTELPELDVDGWFTAAPSVSFNNSYGGEMEYGVVPSF